MLLFRGPSASSPEGALLLVFHRVRKQRWHLDSPLMKTNLSANVANNSCDWLASTNLLLLVILLAVDLLCQRALVVVVVVVVVVIVVVVREKISRWAVEFAQTLPRLRPLLLAEKHIATFLVQVVAGRSLRNCERELHSCAVW
jgi:Flp pilus assembly protein TadB